MILGDMTAVMSAITGISLLSWLLVLGLSLLNYWLRFERWHAYLAVLGDRLPRLRHMTIYLAGFALTTTPGKAGEALRSVYLAPFGVSYKNSLAALFTERLIDFLAIVFLAACVLFEFDGYTHWLGLLAGLIFLLLVVLRRPMLLGQIRGWLHGGIRAAVRRTARPGSAPVGLPG